MNKMIKDSGPYITILGAITAIIIYFNTNVDNKIIHLEGEIDKCIKQPDVDRRIDEKLVPVMHEFKLGVQQLNAGMSNLNDKIGQVNEKISMITEIKVRHQRD